MQRAAHVWNGAQLADRAYPEAPNRQGYWSSFSSVEDKLEFRQIIRYELAEADGGV